MRLNHTESVRRGPGFLCFRRENAFTFFEIMVTLVILSVGLTGVYRAFLIALDYQQYVLIKLHVINVLSDELARAENILIQKTDFSSASGEIDLPVSQGSRFFVQRSIVPSNEDRKGIRDLQVRLLWSQGNRSREFTRGSFVYVKEESF